MANNKLELTWYGKENDISVEPRILIEDKSLSYSRPSGSLLEDDISDNLLIHGDNLLALKALEQDFAGRVKCIYIDPPYNTGAAFEHYDDNLEHSIWLSLMRARLQIMQRLLTNDGTIWITLDDNEAHYCKVMCDEIWGRKNFVADVIWNSRKSVSNDAILSLNTNHILVYAADIETVRAKAKKSEMFKGPTDDSKFSNPDNDPRGPWTADPFDAPEIRPNLTYPIKNPNTGVIYMPAKGRHWRTTKDAYLKALEEGRIVFGKTGTSKPQMKRYLFESLDKGSTLSTLWSDLDTTTNATKHSQKLFDKPFKNPKPEDLIERVLQLATKENDLVMDSFLGSGTTAAVAHKMHRRWIGIEMGDQAYTHCKVRMDKVIDGTDKGGITKEAGWQGGGGYRFYELAPTLIKEDAFGQPVINGDYSPEMLAAAVAKHEGYKYEPDKDCYWKQSRSEANTYLYVTTQHVGEDAIQNILNGMQDYEFLLIVCKSFDSGVLADLDKRISIKKIPQSLLKNCEFGVDNYNLNIVCPPEYEEDEDDE